MPCGHALGKTWFLKIWFAHAHAQAQAQAHAHAHAQAHAHPYTEYLIKRGGLPPLLISYYLYGWAWAWACAWAWA